MIVVVMMMVVVLIYDVGYDDGNDEEVWICIFDLDSREYYLTTFNTLFIQ